MVKFSVIVPVYNAAKSIERCVDSLVKSSGNNSQIILVEDCSKDNSFEVCRCLAHKYSNVTLLHNEQNRGVSHTRNRGLDAATGEFILFCDSDDWVETDWSSVLINEASVNQSWLPICGFQEENNLEVVNKVQLWSDYGTIDYVPLHKAFDVFDRVLLQQLWTKAFQRTIIHKNNIHFDESQAMGEDLQFVLDYLEAGNFEGFSIISTPLYHYNSNSGTLMSNFGLINRDEEYQRLQQLGRITRNEERYKDELKRMKENHVYHILRSKLPMKKKRELAHQILGTQASAYCRAQCIVMLKEYANNLFNIKNRK